MVTLVSVSCVIKVFIGGAVAFIGKRGAITFIDKGSLAVGGRLFETVKAGVNRHDLRWWLIIYELKGPLVLINSLISVSDYFVGLSL